MSAERARQLGVELVPTLEELVAERRLPHHPPAEDARDDRARSAPTCSRKAKPGAADRQHRARRHRRRGRARRRDRATARSPAPRSTCSRPSPPPSRRCSSSTRVVVTPHLGASTVEAQDKAGRHDRRAGRARAAPASSCRSPSTSPRPRRRETVRPFLPLAERLGRLFTALAGGVVRHARGRATRARSPTTTAACSRCRC